MFSFTCDGEPRLVEIGGGIKEGKESIFVDVPGSGALEKMKAGEHAGGVLEEGPLNESLFWKPGK